MAQTHIAKYWMAPDGWKARRDLGKNFSLRHRANDEVVMDIQKEYGSAAPYVVFAEKMDAV
jgi:hypothetical protein